MGTAKEVVGGLTGKSNLKSQGEQQAVCCPTCDETACILKQVHLFQGVPPFHVQLRDAAGLKWSLGV